MTDQAAAVKKKKKSEIKINNLCTGCKICVEICPADVLAMVDAPAKVAGVVSCAVNPDACTRCMLCEIHCPDFAITVTEIED